MCSRRRSGWCLMVLKWILVTLWAIIVWLVPWWLLQFPRWLLCWLFLFIVAFSVMVSQSSVVVSFTGWQHVFPGSVVQLPCRHSFIELSAKYGSIECGLCCDMHTLPPLSFFFHVFTFRSSLSEMLHRDYSESIKGKLWRHLGGKIWSALECKLIMPCTRWAQLCLASNKANLPPQLGSTFHIQL